MSAWVIYRKQEDQKLYWRGYMTDRDQPAVSMFRADAKKFSSWAGALEACDTHEALADSERWSIECLGARPINGRNQETRHGGSGGGNG